jgi:hypothetical protein
VMRIMVARRFELHHRPRRPSCSRPRSRSPRRPPVSRGPPGDEGDADPDPGSPSPATGLRTRRNTDFAAAGRWS